jgi:redox-sensitive bicupin YhaK (pirin superfamily)
MEKCVIKTMQDMKMLLNQGEQWMAAGRGKLHSEMPEQEDGLLQGFLLWVNLPRVAKMSEPKYQEYLPESIAVEYLENGATVKVITGKINLGRVGPVDNNYVYPTFMDISLPFNSEFTQSITAGNNAFVYVIEGSVSIVDTSDSNTKELTEQASTGKVLSEKSLPEKTLSEKTLGILGDGEQVTLVGGNIPSRILLLAGKPLNEPVARSGPFVMNSQEEIRQAFSDYQRGLF